jgi:hypothetical protein
MTEWGCGMSFVIAVPEMVASAASNLTSLGSMISEAHTAAAASTTAIAPAAADEVSAAIASLFSSHARDFQALSAQAAAFHAQFVRALTGAGNSYAATEAANASSLQTVNQDLQNLLLGAEKGYEQERAYLQTLFEAYENDPSLANLAALQLAFAELSEYSESAQQIIDGFAGVAVAAARALGL